MKAPTSLVLAASVVVASPALLLLNEGAITLQGVVERWLICLVVCRVLISVVAAVAFPDPTTTPAETDTAEAESTPRAGHEAA